MKALLILAAAAPLISAHPQPEDPMELPHAQATSAQSERHCRDTVTDVREDRGLPRLDRRTASPEEPLFYAAVDHRVDGCTVLVMKDPEDGIRPVPETDPRKVEFIPAR